MSSKGRGNLASPAFLERDAKKMRAKVTVLIVGVFLIIFGIIKPVNASVILDQNFDSEDTGSVPSGWSITNSAFGDLSVDNSKYYGLSGNSARFDDNSSSGYPLPYRPFPAQSTLPISVEFALMKKDIAGVDDGAFMFYVDDGTYSGGNVYLKLWQEGVYYYDGAAHYIGNYAYNTWYKFNLIIDIPNNTYDIYRDGDLLASGASFRGSPTYLNRVCFGATTAGIVEGYLDDLRITVIPEPATMLLLGSGLLGLAALGRRKNRRA